MAVGIGQSLELFFIDGKPDGMLTAQIFNWTGHVFVTPRIRLAEALKRRESNYTGVYVLLGESADRDRTIAYIGESENVADRIRNHDTRLDWWTQAVFITTTGNGLNKAHVKYLESRLVEEARAAGRFDLRNGNTPPRPSLSEAAQSDMEQFVEYVLTILPAIRIDGFLVKTRPEERMTAAPTRHEASDTTFILRTGTEVFATATLTEGEFKVQPGSFGRIKWVGVAHNYQRLFDEVVASGVYPSDGHRRIFEQAYAFSSPSAAGAVLNGRATAGPIAWTLESNPEMTYRDWEAEQLEQAKVKAGGQVAE